MVKLGKVVKFIVNNRRIIGVVIGGIFTLAGFPDIGDFATKAGEL